jgi:hypothetical protein
MSDRLDELAAWWAALPPEWVFLSLLPLLVGAVGLLVDWGGGGEPEPRPRPRPRPLAPLRRRHRHRGSH